MSSYRAGLVTGLWLAFVIVGAFAALGWIVAS